MKGEKTKVLVVDDDEFVREIVSELLSEAGYDAVLASSGRDAIKLYSECPQDYIAIILDSIMPKMNGHETFQAIRQLNSDAKIIVASGYSYDSAGVQELLDNGANAFVSKPFKNAELIATIEKFQ